MCHEWDGVYVISVMGAHESMEKGESVPLTPNGEQNSGERRGSLDLAMKRQRAGSISGRLR